MPRNDKPIYGGRFNYLSFRADSYNVLFFPFSGSVATIIARNLSKEDALALIGELNAALDDSREGTLEVTDEEEM